MEYLKSVIPVIESNYVNFTTVERSIADFFIYNREQMDFSAKSVPESCLCRRRPCRGLQRSADSGVTGNSFTSMRKILWSGRTP